jgi:putative glutamine amidotransferase
VRISVKHPADSKTLSALVIGGGNDISPEHYGGDIHEKVKADPERDKLEIDWIKFALQNNFPLLGICRGAQLINVVCGGNLHQDIRELRKHTHNRPGLLPTKSVKLTEGSRLREICQTTALRVNSLHHQAVKKPGDGLAVVGRDRDQIVQALESTEQQHIIGVQWHPEYLCYLPSQLALFRWLVREIK